MAARCAAERVGHPRYLLRLSELEFIHGYQRMMQRCIAVTDGTGGKAGRLDRTATSAGGLRRNPDSNGDVTIVLPVTQDCAAGSHLHR